MGRGMGNGDEDGNCCRHAVAEWQNYGQIRKGFQDA
jgi:hypothetical protein